MNNTVTVTLEVTLAQASSILALLQGTSSEAHTSSIANDLSPEDSLPIKAPSKAPEQSIGNITDTVTVQTVKMPTLGRTETQIAEEQVTRINRLEAVKDTIKAKTEKQELNKQYEQEVKEITDNTISKIVRPVDKPKWLQG